MSKTSPASLLATSFVLAIALGGCAAPQSDDPAETHEPTATSTSALEVFCHPSIKADGTLETACDPALIGGSDGSGGSDKGGPNAPGGTPRAQACDDTCTDVYVDCAAACTTVSCNARCSRGLRTCELRCH